MEPGRSSYSQRDDAGKEATRTEVVNAMVRQVMPREKTGKERGERKNDNCNDTDKYTTKEKKNIDRMRSLSDTASAATSTLHLACTRDSIMRLATRVAPLQNGKVRRHVRRREERMNGLRMSVRVLRREVYHQRRVRHRGCGHTRGEVRE